MGLFDKLFNNKHEELTQEVGNVSEQALDEKRDMIEGIEELPNTAVKEVMVPRTDVAFLPLDISQDELLETISESGHSRFPVYSESIDNVVGVLYVKDLINVFAKKEPIELEKILRKAFFVPETKRIDSLLREFKKRHVHIAIALDEYSGVSGIICLEDIIEEIVGDIKDEFDKEEEDILFVKENEWICNARMNIDDLNEEIETSIPNEGFDSIGGFVFDLFGKVPVKFEKVSWNGLDFIVQDMQGHGIHKVKIIKRIEDSEE